MNSEWSGKYESWYGGKNGWDHLIREKNNPVKFFLHSKKGWQWGADDGRKFKG